ncbi:hypothetical protein B0T25DRAFT_457803 [Lasiosphaeria hispida]|uniref:F-box domain-containing protein n=1 Tax=Lasiosphaeria hispida TaxID=260671 RepID=A0AAJ0HEP5_9PEZI|nr:hypothetical protein B0T25DRAFT_457803 [Lasiosphaeria hispida]
MSFFLNLPTETLCLIVTYLDPVSLISLSQTSRAFRSLISPDRSHFIQRLLALELLPEFGGIVPRFRSRDNNLAPPWEDAVWTTNKYACAGCMRFLSHMMFDNHSILRLGLRKPPPDSYEANKLTDWEPLELRNKPVHFRRVGARAIEERKAWGELQLHYRWAAEGIYPAQWGSPPGSPGTHERNPFERADQDLLDAEAEVAEQPLCGIARHKRLCNNCRMLRGLFLRPTSSHYANGHHDIPIVKSRRLRCPDTISRCFPGLFDPLPDDQLPRLFKVDRESGKDSLFTLYTTPCASCFVWQEIAGFRRFPSTSDWTPEHSQALPEHDGPWSGWCNHCILHKIGREELAHRLRCKATILAKQCLRHIECRLEFGWRFLLEDFYDKDGGSLGKLHPSAARDILGGLGFRVNNRLGNNVKFDRTSMPDLLRRVRRFRKFLDNEAGPSVRENMMQSWFRMWAEDYELNVACFFRQLDILEKLSDKDFLVDFVIQKAPYHVSLPQPSMAANHDDEAGLKRIMARRTMPD